jgi:hypothetical protein
MKAILVVAVLALVGWWVFHLLAAAGGSEVSMTDSEVMLATDDLDVRFSRGESVDATYMIFGGAHTDHGNAIGKVGLSAIDVRRARPIHAKHPDFHKCKSPGARLAQNSVVQLDLVPANGKAFQKLKSAIAQFSRNLDSAGDRVCVNLQGESLKLQSVEVREEQQSLTEQFGSRDYLLVTSVDTVDCKAALGG